MTDERNPQDPARELAEKLYASIPRPAFDPKLSKELAEYLDRELVKNTAIKTFTALIAAHTASQLAGAVPLDNELNNPETWEGLCDELGTGPAQAGGDVNKPLSPNSLDGAVPEEELRALIKQWRNESTFASSGSVPALVLVQCASELESLVEKRK